MTKKEKVFYYGLIFVIAYLTIAEASYAFSHPEMTQTQIMINIVDALLWR